MADGIRLYQIDSSNVDLPAACSRCLSAEEQLRANRLRHATQRRRFIAARATLRHLLGQELTCAPEQVRLVYGAAGRPELAWPPANVSFNLSHSRSTTLIGLTHDASIGVDLEALDQEVDSLSIGRLVFCADEFRQLARCAPDERKGRFFRLWTAKEAVLKLLGTGFSLDPRDVSVAAALAWGTPVRVPARAMLRAPHSNIRVVELVLDPLHAAALAVSSATTP